MDTILNEDRFDYLSNDDKAFILAFNDEMTRLGYGFGDKIGSGYCWGKHMVIYTKAGAKSKKVYARISVKIQYSPPAFLSEIDKHHQYIELAPSYIKEVFTGDYGSCRHCRDDQDGKCMFRKSYTIDDRLIEKCNGTTF